LCPNDGWREKAERIKAAAESVKEARNIGRRDSNGMGKKT